MDAHIGSASEYESTCIPPQYHPGPGGICANSIGHGKKRKDMLSAAMVCPRTLAMEYRL